MFTLPDPKPSTNTMQAPWMYATAGSRGEGSPDEVIGSLLEGLQQTLMKFTQERISRMLTVHLLKEDGTRNTGSITFIVTCESN